MTCFAPHRCAPDRCAPRRRWFGTACSLLLIVTCAAAFAHAGETDLRTVAAQERARPLPARFERSQFLARPALAGAWLSPDGRDIVYLREEGNQRGLWRLPTAGGKPQRLLAQTEATDPAWSRDSQWIFVPTARQLFVMAMRGQAGTRAIVALGGRNPIEFFGIDPYASAAALLLETPPLVSRQAQRWRIHRVDTRGTRTVVWEDARPIIDFEVGKDGRLAYLLRAEDDRQVLYRVVRNRTERVLECVRVERCSLIGTLDGGRTLLLNTDAFGDFGRLVRIDADGRRTTLHQDPHGADLHQVTLDPLTRAPLFAAYRSTVASVHALQPEETPHLARLQARFPQRDLRIEVGRGADARWLVHVRAATFKGEQLHLYDPATGLTREVLAGSGFLQARKPVAALPEAAMARKLPMRYTASDGMQLHGFVTLPPGVDAARAPLVVNVHGGPFNLVRPEFSAQTQMLANRGYIVFEPNFRGSTGHGRTYLLAANGDFGNGRVQQDIVEGTRYLLGQGIGDAQRVGILGASFGGYSALQGVTFQPDLFKVAIAAVPPADFGWVLRWYAQGRDQMSRGIPMATTMRLLSLDPADPALAQRLREQSPIANAARMQRPLLLLAGADDERIPVRSVLHYAAQLRALDKDVSLFVDAEGQHQLVNPVTREAYLYLTEAMLHRYLGGPAPAAPDPALRAALKRNLRLRGRGLSPTP